MYGKDFWERLDLRQVCAYLQEGEDIPPRGTGTLEERAKLLEQDWYSGLEAYRDRVLETDWDSGDRTLLTEELTMPLERVRWDAEDLSFEAGFCAGLRLARALDL